MLPLVRYASLALQNQLVKIDVIGKKTLAELRRRQLKNCLDSKRTKLAMLIVTIADFKSRVCFVETKFTF